MKEDLGAYLKDVSSVSSPSSSEPARLTALLLLAAGEAAGECVLEVAGEDCLERALRETVLPLSRACRRKSCMVQKTRNSRYVVLLRSAVRFRQIGSLRCEAGCYLKSSKNL